MKVMQIVSTAKDPFVPISFNHRVRPAYRRPARCEREGRSMKNMNITKILTIPVAVVSLSLGASCSNYSSAAKNDAATGALLGGGLGAVIGNQSGNAGTGAAIGAAAGAAGGYAVGNEKDKRRRY